MMRSLSLLCLLALCPAVVALGGVVEFNAALPAELTAPQPLVATGVAGKGDLVLVGRDGTGALRFGWDHSGEGVLWGTPVPADQPGTHHFTVQLPNLAPVDPTDRLLVVLMDERVVFFVAGEVWPAAAGDPHLGTNASGLASAGRQLFASPISAVPTSGLAGDGNAWRQIFRWAPRADPVALPAGPVRLHVTLPRGALGQAEPLLVTGVTGKSDSVFVRYVDAGHVILGFDHWGYGAAQSAPLAVDYAKPHELEVDLASLHGRGGPKEPVTVWLDGRRVLESTLGIHSSEVRRIIFGVNEVGASTSQPKFTGSLTLIDYPRD